MSRKSFLAVLMMMALLFFNSQRAAALPVELEFGYTDPTEDQGELPRGPVLVPEVSLEDYVLTFSTPCYSYTLELLDGDGEVVYTTIINSTTVNLPSTLSGNYELCLYPDGSNIYFFGYVMF